MYTYCDSRYLCLQASFHAVERWLSEVDRYGRDTVCKLLVGNKADLKSKRVITYETGQVRTLAQVIKTKTKKGLNKQQIGK